MESLWTFSSSVSEIEDTIYCTFFSAVFSELFLKGLNLPEILETMMLLIACLPARNTCTSMAQSHLCNIILSAAWISKLLLSLGRGAFRPASSCHLQHWSTGVILIPFLNNQMLPLGRQSEDERGLKGPFWKSKAILDARAKCPLLNKQCFLWRG